MKCAALLLAVTLPLLPLQSHSAGATEPVSTNQPALKELLQARTFTNATGMVMVRLGENQWAGKHLVTQATYQKVIGSNPSRFGGPQNPVDSVSWNDALHFCAELTRIEKEKGYLPENCVYTLPTQAQWESMVSGTPLTQAITSERRQRSGTAPVGSLAANPLGLHDIRGNLWQWCLDPADKPYRVLRGGAWNTSLEVNLRPEFRWYSTGPDERKETFGFRCVLQPSR